LTELKEGSYLSSLLGFLKSHGSINLLTPIDVIADARTNITLQVHRVNWEGKKEGRDRRATKAKYSFLIVL
jgi:hypothetical protein